MGGLEGMTSDREELAKTNPVRATLLYGAWTEDQREHYEERAAIMEYDGGLPRAEAERKAKDFTDG